MRAKFIISIFFRLTGYYVLKCKKASKKKPGIWPLKCKHSYIIGVTVFGWIRTLSHNDVDSIEYPLIKPHRSTGFVIIHRWEEMRQNVQRLWGSQQYLIISQLEPKHVAVNSIFTIIHQSNLVEWICTTDSFQILFYGQRMQIQPTWHFFNSSLPLLPLQTCFAWLVPLRYQNLSKILHIIIIMIAEFPHRSQVQVKSQGGQKGKQND